MRTWQQKLLQFIALLICSLTFQQCADKPLTDTERYLRAPQFVHEFVLTDGGDTLAPVRVEIDTDSLFVSYRDLPRIDVYSLSGDLIRRIDLLDPEAVYPSSFVVLDSELVVVDHTRKVIVIYDRVGIFKHSFGLLPDHQTSLTPFAVTEYGGVLYVTDLSLRKVLAISNTDADGITERGELILSFPNDTARTLGFPSATYVTIDGRLLVGDAGDGDVEVFTCDGRHVYRFDDHTAAKRMAPQAFASDNLADPELLDSTTFDPSNIRLQGRVHVVDGNNAQIHLYSPLGRYVGSYPTDGRLEKPTGITVELWTRNVYITDPVKKRVFVYHYGS